MKRIFISAFILSLTLSLSGCSLLTPAKGPRQVSTSTNPNQKDNTSILPSPMPTISEQLAAQKNIKKFTSLDEFSEFLAEADIGDTYSSRYGGVNDMLRGAEVEGMAMPTMAGEALMQKSDVAPAERGGGSDDYSTTNIQVEGVDEADIIKTDGEFVYALVKNDLYIVRAYPAVKADVLAKIEFKSRPQDLFFNKNHLIVFGQDANIYNTDIYKRFKRRNQYTFFKVFDIEDPTNPKEVRDLDIEGSYTDSRMIGDYVYFVTTNYNYYYIDGEPLLPRLIEDGDVLTVDCAVGRCYNPDIYYFDIPYNNYNFTNITAVNVVNTSEQVKGEMYMLSGNQNMYVSQANIYITYTKYISEYTLEMEALREIVYPMLSARDQEKVAKIEATENFILSVNEKKRKIEQIIERYGESLTDEEQKALEAELEQKMKDKYKDISKELEKTIIHKIAIKQGDLEYQANGEVTGQVLNQFSMDESDGYLRIATTKNRTWSRYDSEEVKSYSNLYVLDSDLKLAGAVEKLAEGERIYSVRFMGDRAYMVTFQQTDPLFVIDLSDPKNPAVLGKLKIPGFSNYLHPYDNNTLIGLGKDTSVNQWGGVTTKGLKLSLFDVSDVNKPKEIDSYVMGGPGSESIALRDHKAFLFSLEKNLLVIPVSIRESFGSNGYGRFTFGGAAVFTVDKSGFKLRDKIDHSNGGQPSDSDYWRGYSYYDNTVKRSLFIDDVLYTFSNKYLKMNSLDDLETIKSLELKKTKTGGDDDYTIIK